METLYSFFKYCLPKFLLCLVLVSSSGCYDSYDQNEDEKNLVENIKLQKSDMKPDKIFDLKKSEKYFSKLFSTSDNKSEPTDSSYTIVLPRFARTLPASPSAQMKPTVEGSTTPKAEVTLYSDSNCKLALAKGIADRQGQFKMNIKVEMDSRTKIFAKADLDGFSSGCSTDYLSYKQDSIAAESPVWVKLPPSGITPQKSISVKLSATAEDILTIYSDSECKDSVLENQSNIGPSTRELLVVLEDNKNYQFSAMTTDIAGNRSACVFSGQNLSYDSEHPTAKPIGDSQLTKKVSSSDYLNYR